MNQPVIEPFDVLVIGGGLAGFYTAVKLAPLRVLLVTADYASCSMWAQGGIAAAMGEDDSFLLHEEDTLKAGAGLCDVEAVRVLTREGPARIEELIRLGVPFEVRSDGRLDLGLEAAHSRKRIVHADHHTTGKALIAALAKEEHVGHIQFLSGYYLEDHFAHRLPMCFSAPMFSVWHDNGNGHYIDKPVMISAPHTVFATGGCGALWAKTTNPFDCGGEALAVAYRCGAVLQDLEMMQFHPTALDVGGQTVPLATEALRGAGARLVDRSGAPFMERYDKRLDLAPRDTVARAVFSQIEGGDGAFLDLRPVLDKLETHFPTMANICTVYGFDPTQQLIPITPAAHYHMGGIKTDLYGRTSVEGLWAVGEVASTGVHGANRLASNSLLEALVFGARAAEAIKAEHKGDRIGQASHFDGSDDTLAPLAPYEERQVCMQKNLGVMRSSQGLQEACDALVHKVIGGDEPAVYALNDPDVAGCTRLRNRALASQLIAISARMRTETRGAHYRTDYPHTLPIAAHTHIQLTSERVEHSIFLRDVHLRFGAHVYNAKEDFDCGFSSLGVFSLHLRCSGGVVMLRIGDAPGEMAWVGDAPPPERHTSKFPPEPANDL